MRTASAWSRIGRDSAIFGGGAMAMVAMQAVFRLVAIHDLPKADYGRVALLITLFNYALVLGNFGIPSIASRLAARTRHESGSALLASLGRASLLPCAAASLGLAGVTFLVVGSPAIALMTAAGMPAMVISTVAAGFLRGRGSTWRAGSIQPANAAAQLVFLLALTGLGIGVGTGWVLVAFYAGNACAFAYAVVLLVPFLRRPAQRSADQLAEPRAILSVSAWLAVATLGVYGLAVVPRVALAPVSYDDVATFDVALLVYTIPQRLVASMVIAVVPLAASVQLRRARLAVPALSDALTVTLAFLALDAVLWSTHALRTLFLAIGLGEYAAAEHLVLIVLLAAPAEFLFGLNSGLLQGFGRTRRLAYTTCTVLGVTSAAVPVAVLLGTSYLAGLLVLAYWALYLASRPLLRSEEVVNRPLVRGALALVRARHAHA
jgi:O-antigen/teichoic acid export membrane protein